MNTRTAITAIALLGFLPTGAQNVQQEPQEDPVQKAIREFNRRDEEKPNEVTVVLAPEESDANSTEEPASAETTETAPLLVTGTAPKGTELVAKPEAPQEPDLIPEPPPEPPKGLTVRVKEIQAGSGNVDPSKVKLLAPFPAKPLATPPAGWHLETSADAPPFTRDVEIASGKSITLTIHPHLLVPDADGVNAFNITEPGFDATLGYYQNSTVSAILSKSVRQLEDDSKNLSAAIDQLQQVLVSLPTADPQPESKTTPKR